ncbi:ribose ABC transporter permease [Bacillus sp. FJAT-50079]|uniref:ABC transporter permease n=1 Tax=Bacillus sp. FJAT-50079 TaxID=2833577 RepID=UPI0020161904|nr:ribose ABC transporter permease [Bacillus sp. FJAT-50079]
MKISKKNRVKDFFAEFGIIIALIVLCAVLTVLNDRFLTSVNILNILRQISIIGILAIGMTFVVITAGIDLSVGSVLAFTGVVAASFGTGQNILLSIVLGLIAGAILGFINGTAVARWKIAPFIVTLGMMTAARGLTYIYSDGKPVSGLSSEFMAIGQGSFIGIPIPVWILLGVFLISQFILNQTRIGRYIYAVGGNQKAATFSGINVVRVKAFVYTFSGLLCGLAGIVLTARVSAGLPQAGAAYELDAIAAVVIGGTSLAGGRGKLWGTVIGVLIIGVLSNGLDLMGVSSYYQQIIKGIIIVLAVLLDKKRSE